MRGSALRRQTPTALSAVITPFLNNSIFNLSIDRQMKILFICMCLLCLLTSSSLRAQKLTFTYDVGGNQIERRWTCVNCRTVAGFKKAEIMSKENGKLSSLNETSPTGESMLKVAPNPFTEELKVKWGGTKEIFLKKIEVYDVGGRMVLRHEYLPNQQYSVISFQNLPPGQYLVVAYYSNSTKETLKVIKI